MGPRTADETGIGRRGTLSRDRILQAALDIVDAHGAEAVTMRRIAGELGVDPMALYRHVKDKDALLDGMVELLWRQVPLPPRQRGDWIEPLRSYAHALRDALMAHPCAAGLLLARPVMFRPVLEAYDTLLGNIRDGGFDDAQAAQILRSVISSAFADAIANLTYRSLSSGSSETDALISLSQALPEDTPAHLVRTAYAVCGTCEPDADFTFVLDLILNGAQDIRSPEKLLGP